MWPVASLSEVEPVQMPFAPGLSVERYPESVNDTKRTCTKCHTLNSEGRLPQRPFLSLKSIVTADDKAAPFCYAYEWEEERFSVEHPARLHAGGVAMARMLPLRVRAEQVRSST